MHFICLPRPGLRRRDACCSRKRVFCPPWHSSRLVTRSGFMLMSGKLSEKRLPDVAGYHTAMEVGRTSHSLPPFGFPRLRFSQSQRYFCLFSLRGAISLGIQWMSVYPHLSGVLMVIAGRAAVRARRETGWHRAIGDQCEIDGRREPDRTPLPPPPPTFSFRFLPGSRLPRLSHRAEEYRTKFHSRVALTLLSQRICKRYVY